MPNDPSTIVHYLNPDNSLDIWIKAPTWYGRIKDEILIVGGQSKVNEAYMTLLHFNVNDLPEDITSVILELYCLNAKNKPPPYQNSPLYFNFIEESWKWRLRGDDWFWWDDAPSWDHHYRRHRPPVAGQWFRVGDFEPRYRKWKERERKGYGEVNYGLVILLGGPSNYTYDSLYDQLYEFCSTEYADPRLRPRLVIKINGIPGERFWFPLAGKYSPARKAENGYDFGDHWQNEHCQEAGLKNIPLLHTGVDFRASPGDFVYAIADGVVQRESLGDKWGGYVVIEHDRNATSTYWHVEPLSDISYDDAVMRGRPIGTVASGNSYFQPHLHFQFRNAPFKAEDEVWILRGRLPKESCIAEKGGWRQEPAFPEHFVDPKTLDWEK